MPTYEYKCPKCGTFEVLQRISESALEHCPECGSPVKRLISRNVNIIFKGPGFYCTDNRPKGYAEQARNEGLESALTAEDKKDKKADTA